jgi:hypothetical protein
MTRNRPFLAHIRPGVNDSVTVINTRTGPGTRNTIPFTARTETNNLTVLDVRPDEDNTSHNDKRYQWFQLRFSDGRTAWVRDDLINVSGDGSRFGYEVVMGTSYAFELTRAETDTSDQSAEQPTDATDIQDSDTEERPEIRATTDAASRVEPIDTETKDAPALPVDVEPLRNIGADGDSDDERQRVIKTAFNITAAFEGSGYAEYQTTDKGIVSYGRFQFTLLSGNLTTVVQRYLDQSDANADIARALRVEYLPRLLRRDESLRTDPGLQELLVNAASSAAMQSVQDQLARERFWQRMYELSVVPRNIRTPLAQALFFDISIQHGVLHNIFAEAEEALNVPIRSRVGENGIAEEIFVKRIAQIRNRILTNIATARDLPGVQTRGEFWVRITREGDWQLQGDANGNVQILGRQVQVRKP